MFREHPVLQINTRPGHLYTEASSALYNNPLWTVKCLRDNELILQFHFHECTVKVTGMAEIWRLSKGDLMGMETTRVSAVARATVPVSRKTMQWARGRICHTDLFCGESWYPHIQAATKPYALLSSQRWYPLFLSPKYQNTSDCNTAAYFTRFETW